MASITIPLFYDLDLLLWTSAAGGIAPQPNLVLGQSDSIAFAVQFVRSGVVIELTSPAWICGIKPINDTAGDYLCQTTTAVKTGSTTTTVYTFTLLLDSKELRAWLLTVTAVSNYAAFSIRDTVNLIATLPAITCTILPDYTLEGTTPTAASGTLIVGSGQTFTVSKSFAMPVDNGTDTYVLKTNGAGVGRWAVDSAGTGTVTNVAVTTANGVSGTVANPTASAAITIALGAITPTTGAFSDNTEATSSTSAPLKTAGGLAVAKKLFVGGASQFSDNVDVNGDLRVYNIVELGGTSLAFTDQADNPTFEIFSVASSVNYVTIEPSVAGSPPHIYAKGAETNIGLHLSPKGTGYVNIQDGNDTSKRLRFGASGNSANVITTLESSSTTSQTITLPNAITSVTLAGLQMVQTFSAAQTFSSTVNLSLNTDATSSTAGGTLTVTGGASVSKKLFVGSLLDLVATTSTAGQITQAGTRLLHTSGTVNLFLGEASGNTALVTTGTTNNGSNNIGIGKNSLLAVTTGTNNTAIGRVTLTALTTGSNNVALGDTSGTSITAGEYNILVGRSSGQYITTGNYNSVIGGLALLTCSAGGANVAIGYQSLGSTNASNNTAVGFNSGYYSTGNNGTYIGNSAGIATATVGGLAGVAITSGVNNTMIGTASSSTSATGTYRTAIGSDSRCQSDNAIKLGRDTLDVVILPSMTTTQRNAYASPVGGSLIFNSTTNKLNFYNGTAWEAVTSA
jgi:hypothetical protein